MARSLPTLGLWRRRRRRRVGHPGGRDFPFLVPRLAAYRIFRRPLQARLDALAASHRGQRAGHRGASRYFRRDCDIIPNGVDVGDFRPNGRVPRRSPARTRGCSSWAAWIPATDSSTMLAAMPLDAVHPQARCRLVVAGDGPAARLLRGTGPAPRRRTVRFLGQVTGGAAASLRHLRPVRLSHRRGPRSASRSSRRWPAARRSWFRHHRLPRAHRPRGRGGAGAGRRPGGLGETPVIDLLDDPERRRAMGARVGARPSSSPGRTSRRKSLRSTTRVARMSRRRPRTAGAASRRPRPAGVGPLRSELPRLRRG